MDKIQGLHCLYKDESNLPLDVEIHANRLHNFIMSIRALNPIWDDWYASSIETHNMEDFLKLRETSSIIREKDKQRWLREVKLKQEKNGDLLDGGMGGRVSPSPWTMGREENFSDISVSWGKQWASPPGEKDIHLPQEGIMNFQFPEFRDGAEPLKTYKILRSFFVRLEHHYHPYWASISTDDYMMEGRVFGRRYKWLGWVGYVPVKLTARDLPMAWKLIDINGKGTMIMTQKEPFSLEPHAVEISNEIEIKLMEMGLLPKTGAE